MSHVVLLTEVVFRFKEKTTRMRMCRSSLSLMLVAVLVYVGCTTSAFAKDIKIGRIRCQPVGNTGSSGIPIDSLTTTEVMWSENPYIPHDELDNAVISKKESISDRVAEAIESFTEAALFRVTVFELVFDGSELPTLRPDCDFQWDPTVSLAPSTEIDDAKVAFVSANNALCGLGVRYGDGSLTTATSSEVLESSTSYIKFEVPNPMTALRINSIIGGKSSTGFSAPIEAIHLPGPLAFPITFTVSAGCSVRVVLLASRVGVLSMYKWMLVLGYSLLVVPTAIFFSRNMGIAVTSSKRGILVLVMVFMGYMGCLIGLVAEVLVWRSLHGPFPFPSTVTMFLCCSIAYALLFIPLLWGHPSRTFVFGGAVKILIVGLNFALMVGYFFMGFVIVGSLQLLLMLINNVLTLYFYLRFASLLPSDLKSLVSPGSITALWLPITLPFSPMAMMCMEVFLSSHDNQKVAKAVELYHYMNNLHFIILQSFGSIAVLVVACAFHPPLFIVLVAFVLITGYHFGHALRQYAVSRRHWKLEHQSNMLWPAIHIILGVDEKGKDSAEHSIRRRMKIAEQQKKETEFEMLMRAQYPDKADAILSSRHSIGTEKRERGDDSALRGVGVGVALAQHEVYLRENAIMKQIESGAPLEDENEQDIEHTVWEYNMGGSVAPSVFNSRTSSVQPTSGNTIGMPRSAGRPPLSGGAALQQQQQEASGNNATVSKNLYGRQQHTSLDLSPERSATGVGRQGRSVVSVGKGGQNPQTLTWSPEHNRRSESTDPVVVDDDDRLPPSSTYSSNTTTARHQDEPIPQQSLYRGRSASQSGNNAGLSSRSGSMMIRIKGLEDDGASSTRVDGEGVDSNYYHYGRSRSSASTREEPVDSSERRSNQQRLFSMRVARQREQAEEHMSTPPPPSSDPPVMSTFFGRTTTTPVSTDSPRRADVFPRGEMSPTASNGRDGITISSQNNAGSPTPQASVTEASVIPKNGHAQRLGASGRVSPARSLASMYDGEEPARLRGVSPTSRLRQSAAYRLPSEPSPVLQFGGIGTRAGLEADTRRSNKTQ